MIFPISDCPQLTRKTEMNGSNAFKNPSETILSTRSFPIRRLQSGGAVDTELHQSYPNQTQTRVNLVRKQTNCNCNCQWTLVNPRLWFGCCHYENFDSIRFSRSNPELRDRLFTQMFSIERILITWRESENVRAWEKQIVIVNSYSFVKCRS